MGFWNSGTVFRYHCTIGIQNREMPTLRLIPRQTIPIPWDFNDDAITESADRQLSASGLRFGRNFLDQSAKLTIDFNYMWEERRGGNKLDLGQDEADLTEWIESKRLRS